jgi:Uncharacterized integral membrane protein
MSEQAKVGFTKGVGGNTYVSEEVDGYLAMLHGAYEEMEGEFNTLKDKHASELAKEQKASQKLKDDNKKYERQKEHLQKDIEGYLVTIESLKKEAQDKKNVSEIEEFYEEKVKGLEALIDNSREEIGNLKKEKASLEEAKRQLETKQIENTPESRAKTYSELFERASNTAQDYIDDATAQAEALVSKAKAEHEQILQQAHMQAFNVVKQAKTQADELVEDSQSKSRDILIETREEYDKIRELIGKASREYAAIASLKHGGERAKEE